MSWSRRRWSRRSLLLPIVAAALTEAPTGLAHIDLTRPVPREQGLRSSDATNADLKAGPCGQRNNGRTNKVNVFSPGETVEVTWTETTNHRSYYRLAFDLDGDDGFPLFAGPGIGQEGDDPVANCPIDGRVILAYELDDRAGGSYTRRITLPDVECESCTLQLVQYMYGSRSPYYFQCADLALRRAADATAHDAGTLDAGATEGALPFGEASLELAAAASCSQRLAPSEPDALASSSGGATGNGATGKEPDGDPSGATAAGANAGPATPDGSRASAGCQLTGTRNQSPFDHLLGGALLTLAFWKRRFRHKCR